MAEAPTPIRVRPGDHLVVFLNADAAADRDTVRRFADHLRQALPDVDVLVVTGCAQVIHYPKDGSAGDA